jgi:hypothetical protein
LRQLDADIEAVRHSVTTARGVEHIELPVKLKVYDSIFVPLAKWSMLLAGNYRCIEANGIRPIRDAVLSNLAASKDVYAWVVQLCERLGAASADLVPFDKYAAAADGLSKPSSSARALLAGAKNIERVDIIVQALAAQLGIQHPSVDQTVALVNQWLAKNRAA